MAAGKRVMILVGVKYFTILYKIKFEEIISLKEVIY